MILEKKKLIPITDTVPASRLADQPRSAQHKAKTSRFEDLLDFLPVMSADSGLSQTLVDEAAPKRAKRGGRSRKTAVRARTD